MISCLEFVKMSFFVSPGLDRFQSVTAASPWLLSLSLQSAMVYRIKAMESLKINTGIKQYDAIALIGADPRGVNSVAIDPPLPQCSSKRPTNNH